MRRVRRAEDIQMTRMPKDWHSGQFLYSIESDFTKFIPEEYKEAYAKLLGRLIKLQVAEVIIYSEIVTLPDGEVKSKGRKKFTSEEFMQWLQGNNTVPEAMYIKSTSYSKTLLFLVFPQKRISILVALEPRLVVDLIKSEQSPLLALEEV